MWPARFVNTASQKYSACRMIPGTYAIRPFAFCLSRFPILKVCSEKQSLVPRKPPTLEILLSAVADAQKLVAKGRVTKRDVKSWESKYLQLRRLE